MDNEEQHLKHITELTEKMNATFIGYSMQEICEAFAMTMFRQGYQYKFESNDN